MIKVANIEVSLIDHMGNDASVTRAASRGLVRKLKSL